MNLENKILNITGLSVSTYPVSTTVDINISEEIGAGIFKVLNSYVLKFDTSYNSTGDPALLAAINEKLAILP
jgi:hypothetical protein